MVSVINFFKNPPQQTFTPEELTSAIKIFFSQNIQDPIKAARHLATIIPLNKFQKCNTILEEAKSMFEEAKYYLQTTDNKISPSIHARLNEILDSLISLIESIVLGLGIADFFKPAESDMHADFRSQKIMMLLSLFSLVSSMLLPLVGAATGATIIGGTLLTISALSAIWPTIKPMPSYLPGNAENWTKKIQQGHSVSEARKESLDEIAKTLKMKRHAILVGPSRVGKGLTAKAFAQAIERGDYPEFKGMKVFRINTAEILDHKASFLGGSSNILKNISDAMGRHRNKIILVLDEIHMACKNKEKIADQLKTYLDVDGDFPHVIGITTNEEYEKYVKENGPFSKRFYKVDIENTNHDETLKILSDALLKSQARPIVEKGIIEKIYQLAIKNKNEPQPEASLKILEKCISQTEKSQKSPTEKKIIAISNQILAINAQSSVYRGMNESKQLVVELEKQLIELKKTLKQEQKEIAALFRAKENLDEVTKEMYRTALKVSSEKDQKLFLLYRDYLAPTLEEHIKTKSKQLGIQVVISEELLHSVTG